MSEQPNPEKILQTGLAFWASKTLLERHRDGRVHRAGARPGAVRWRSAGVLACIPARRATSSTRWWRSASCSAHGDRYANTPETDLFLDRKKPSYVGGILEMANHRLYPFWGHLTEALRTGQPQNEVKGGGPGLFETLYADPARLKEFLAAMTGISHGANMTIARAFPWKDYRTFVDVGTAQGDLAAQIALRQPAPARRRVRPARGGADLRGVRRGGRRRGPADVHAGRLLQARPAEGRRGADGPHPARLGSADEEDAHREGVRRRAGRRRARSSTRPSSTTTGRRTPSG